jgi:hypothetical protein
VSHHPLAHPHRKLSAGAAVRVDKHRTAKRLVRRLDALGYEVMRRSKTAD